MDTTVILSSAVPAIIVGLLSGYLGVHWALKQHRGQRAFDRQLEWYEGTIRSLLGMRRIYFRLSLSFKDPNQKLLHPKELIEPVAAFMNAVDDSLMFAKNTVHQRLERAFNQTQDNHNSMMTLIENGTPDAVLSEKCSLLGKELENIAKELAKDIRDQLSLDELKAQDVHEQQEQ